MEQVFKDFEQNIGYTFKNKSLLKLAMTHPSFANEKHENKDNQRLEFLGDSVLGLIITEYIYEKYPLKQEGALSKLKSVLVSKKILANTAKKIKLNEFILLGIGEANSGGNLKASNLSDAFESLIGAMYLDGGLNHVKTFLINLFVDILIDIEQNGKHKNYKSKLQEIAQEQFNITPEYEIVSEHGPEHNKKFTVTVNINKDFIGTGNGTSKKDAEQKAAKDAIKQLTTINKKS